MSSVGSPKKLLMARDIPSRRPVINDISQLPFDYSTTPGGTLFSTTPGGTRIIYDRSFLMQLRNSPMAKSPPKNLPSIPGVTSPLTMAGKENKPIVNVKTVANPSPDVAKAQTSTAPAEPGDEPQFLMDM